MLEFCAPASKLCSGKNLPQLLPNASQDNIAHSVGTERHRYIIASTYLPNLSKLRRHQNKLAPGCNSVCWASRP